MFQTIDPRDVTSDAPGFDKLIVEFYEEAVLNERASWGWTDERYDMNSGETRKIKHDGAGRPIYDTVEFVEIRIPGNLKEIRRRPVRATDKRKWPREYAAFQQTKTNPVFGTPLEKIPFLTKAQVLEFQAVGLRTAENIRDISDSDSQKFMGMTGLKQKIADWLAAAEGKAPIESLRHELETQAAENAALKAQLQEIGKRKKGE